MARVRGFPGGSDGKESACNAGDLDLIPGLGRSLGEGHGNPFQCSFWENPMDRRAWWITVHAVEELDMTQQLENNKMKGREQKEILFCYSPEASRGRKYVKALLHNYQNGQNSKH